MKNLSILLGERIRQLRQEKKLTLEKLAYESGFSKGYLSDIENGKKLPSIQFLQRLADELKVELFHLFIDPENPKHDKIEKLRTHPHKSLS